MIRRFFHWSSLIVVFACALLIRCTSTKQGLERPPGPGDMHADQRCYRNGGLNSKARAQIFPFDKAARIQVISFHSKLGKTPIANDTIVRSQTIEAITLTADQKDRLTDILYNYNYAKRTNVFEETTTGCYYPRHAIVFLDGSYKVISYMELCLECSRMVTALSPASTGTFCQGKFELLKQFFTSIGITHFKD